MQMNAPICGYKIYNMRAMDYEPLILILLIMYLLVTCNKTNQSLTKKVKLYIIVSLIVIGWICGEGNDEKSGANNV